MMSFQRQVIKMKLNITSVLIHPTLYWLIILGSILFSQEFIMINFQRQVININIKMNMILLKSYIYIYKSYDWIPWAVYENTK